jgi:hypothetical protein
MRKVKFFLLFSLVAKWLITVKGYFLHESFQDKMSDCKPSQIINKNYAHAHKKHTFSYKSNTAGRFGELKNIKYCWK